MTAENQDFDAYQGESIALKMEAFDVAADGTTRTVRDLTNVDELICVVSDDDETAAVITKVLGAGIVITDPTGGLYTVTIDKEDTQLLDPDDYRLEIRIGEAGISSVATVGCFELKRSTTLS